MPKGTPWDDAMLISEKAKPIAIIYVHYACLKVRISQSHIHTSKSLLSGKIVAVMFFHAPCLLLYCPCNTVLSSCIKLWSKKFNIFNFMTRRIGNFKLLYCRIGKVKS